MQRSDQVRASQDQQGQPAAVTLTGAAAGAELERWAGERRWTVQQTDTTAMVNLPLACVPELARQTWVGRMEFGK